MPKITQERKDKPRVFVGSSTEGLRIAEAIQLLLEHDAEVTVWTQGVFEASSNSLDDLIEVLDKIDFGVFVFTPDDISKIKQKKYLVARDNVIFEMGLFVGGLGKKRTLYVIPRGLLNLHLPSDLIGVSPLDYDSNRSDGNIQAALGSACTRIRERINQLGRFEKKIAEQKQTAKSIESFYSQQEEIEFQHIFSKLEQPLICKCLIRKKELVDGKDKLIQLGYLRIKYSFIQTLLLNIHAGAASFIIFDRIDIFHKQLEDAIFELASNYLGQTIERFNSRSIEAEENMKAFLMVQSLLERKENIGSFGSKNTSFNYSPKMFRFVSWLEYYKVNFDEDKLLLEIVEFIADESN